MPNNGSELFTIVTCDTLNLASNFLITKQQPCTEQLIQMKLFMK
jgi:hypothetical protein